VTTEPMTTEELAVIRGAIERTDLFDEETLPLAFSDRKRLLAEVDRLRAENARLAAQERASGPETPQGHPSEGTGVPGPHGAAQAADLTPAEQAADILDNAAADWLDARDKYETETRDARAARLREAGLIGDTDA
jgi:hypothetical protein